MQAQFLRLPRVGAGTAPGDLYADSRSCGADDQGRQVRNRHHGSEVEITAILEGQRRHRQGQATVIEFDLTGKILTANANFLKVTGYVISRNQASTTEFSSAKRSGTARPMPPGKSSGAANTTRAVIAALARAALLSGYRA